MIDITKEEFWNSTYVENNKIRENSLFKLVLKHKVFTGAIISLSLLILTNVILIYNFLKILQNM